MAKESERFVAFGFVKKGVDSGTPMLDIAGRKITIKGEKPEEKLKFMQTTRAQFAKEGLAGEFDKAVESIADHEWAEIAKDQLAMTDHPKSINRYHASIESWHQSIEPYYYWCLNFLGDIGFPVIDKITDIFTAAEHSSFYGAAGQRLGLAQDKVSQYLATIGKMVKDLFQLVRELRWIDERLEMYREAFGEDKAGKKVKEPKRGAELALKGLWVDLVDGVVGGQRTGSNIFVMAQQLQFTALPDLFFSVNPESKPEAKAVDEDEISKAVEEQAKEFNLQVKNLLKRKLAQYIAWKHATYDEMKTRRKFTLDYLRQHYHVIEMYIAWIKPYIKHIERLTGQEDMLRNPRLVSAFESSMIEIELLARAKPEGSSKNYACILMTFEYHTKPSMQYQGDSGYHRGPIHVGTTRITWRGYAWNEKQIDNYIKMRRREDVELLTSVDASLRTAMDALGTDLMNYLEEAEKGKKAEEGKPEKIPMALMEPFTAVGKAFADVVKSLVSEIPKVRKGKGAKEESESPPESTARKLCWTHYNIFKKAHGLLAW